jgi:signal peptidase I
MQNFKERAIAEIKKDAYTAFDILQFMFRTALLMIAFTYIVAFLTIVPTGSMLPTIPLNSMEIAVRCAYWFSSPQRGDVIVFYRDSDMEIGHMLTKRVIGIPGDRVRITDGVLYINDEPQEEKYLMDDAGDDFAEVTVPDGKYLMMGDNRDNSFDGRYWDEHFVSKNRIVAKCYYIINSSGFQKL